MIRFKSISLLSLIILPFIAIGQGGISISPSKVYFIGNPGEQVSQEVIVQNPTNEPVDILTYFADWQRDSFGTKIYAEPGTLPASCYDWIEQSDQSMHLEPGATKSIRLFMQIPEDSDVTSEMKNCMLFLKQNRGLASIRNDGVHLHSKRDVYFQLGAQIYYIPTELNLREIEIRNLEKADTEYLRIALENTGNLHLEANIKLELTNKGTGEEYIIFKDPKRVSFLPGDFRYVRMELPSDLPTGEYSALTIVDIDPNLDLQIGMLDFDH